MKEEGLHIRFCKEEDLERILALQEEVFADLEDRASLLRRNTRETFQRCLQEPNFTLGVFDGGELIAVSIMEDARGREDDLGIRLQTHKIHDYADFKLVMVRRGYYGRGLQKTLMRITENMAYKRGYRWFCTSVSPDNVYSRENIRAMGYELDSRMELYGGLEREIYVKELIPEKAAAEEAPGFEPETIAPKRAKEGDEPEKAAAHAQKRVEEDSNEAGPARQKIADTLRGKRVLIWGYGLEGKSAEAFIQKHCEVASLTVFEGKQQDIDEDAYDCIIKSPGIREDWWNMKYTSVTELFLQEFAPQVIGVTGTKGKSTTVSMLYEVLSACIEAPVLLVGNIGIPCLDAYDEITEDSVIVFELSCHQLDHLRVSPHVAVFLNLFEEHLDHYDTFKRYFRAKISIALFQNENDFLYIGDQVPRIMTPANRRVFPMPQTASAEASTANDSTAPFTGNAAPAFDLQLVGAHNQYNAGIVYAIATELFACDGARVREALAAFHGLRHRMEYLGQKDGVDYYDDSISTIPEATIAALTSIPHAKTVLVGGMDRGIDYTLLIEFIQAHPEYQYVCMYASGKRIFDALPALPYCSYAEDLAAAVRRAKEITQPGEACLLSPAAASYGDFKNFEERGDVFRDLVMENPTT